MKIAYFDCFAGAAGDMIVGSLIHAGADIEKLREHLNNLPITGYEIQANTACRGGMDATKFDVIIDNSEKPHRHLHHIIEIIEAAKLPPRAEKRAKDIFNLLARAESSVHGTTIEKVHFHEVGAIDSIVDIVGTCVALELLDIDAIECNAIATGNGIIECEHGKIPAPAPATARLLAMAHCPTFASPNKGEATTPTAAAILTALCPQFGPMPEMIIDSVGYGCGTRDGQVVPNVLRVFTGQESDDSNVDSVVEISANIDDCTGELVGYAIEKLLEAGCLDAWASPAYAKKSRPCWVLSCLVRPAQVQQAEDIIFAQTTTMGLRKSTANRIKLQVKFTRVETPFGTVRVKQGLHNGQANTASVEFEDAKHAAQAHGVSVKKVIEATLSLYHSQK